MIPGLCRGAAQDRNDIVVPRSGVNRALPAPGTRLARRARAGGSRPGSSTQAAGRRAVRPRDGLVPAAPGRRRQSRQDQAVESARSRELFMSVSLLRGPGEANHRDSVMTSHLPGGKPGSVATDIGSLDLTKRNRDLEQRGRRRHRPERPGHQAAGRQPPARTGTAVHRLVLAHLACRARPPPGRLPPAGPAGRGRRQFHRHPLDQPVRRVLTQLIRNSPAPGTLPATLPALPPQQAAPQETFVEVTRDAADDRTPAANGELAATAFAVRRCEA
jgi:hypothetical protein